MRLLIYKANRRENNMREGVNKNRRNMKKSMLMIAIAFGFSCLIDSISNNINYSKNVNTYAGAMKRIIESEDELNASHERRGSLDITHSYRKDKIEGELKNKLDSSFSYEIPLNDKDLTQKNKNLLNEDFYNRIISSNRIKESKKEIENFGSNTPSKINEIELNQNLSQQSGFPDVRKSGIFSKSPLYDKNYMEKKKIKLEDQKEELERIKQEKKEYLSKQIKEIVEQKKQLGKILDKQRIENAGVMEDYDAKLEVLEKKIDELKKQIDISPELLNNPNELQSLITEKNNLLKKRENERDERLGKLGNIENQYKNLNSQLNRLRSELHKTDPEFAEEQERKEVKVPIHFRSNRRSNLDIGRNARYQKKIASLLRNVHKKKRENEEAKVNDLMNNQIQKQKELDEIDKPMARKLTKEERLEFYKMTRDCEDEKTYIKKANEFYNSVAILHVGFVSEENKPKGPTYRTMGAYMKSLGYSCVGYVKKTMKLEDVFGEELAEEILEEEIKKQEEEEMKRLEEEKKLKEENEKNKSQINETNIIKENNPSSSPMPMIQNFNVKAKKSREFKIPVFAKLGTNGKQQYKIANLDVLYIDDIIEDLITLGVALEENRILRVKGDAILDRIVEELIDNREWVLKYIDENLYQENIASQIPDFVRKLRDGYNDSVLDLLKQEYYNKLDGRINNNPNKTDEQLRYDNALLEGQQQQKLATLREELQTFNLNENELHFEEVKNYINDTVKKYNPAEKPFAGRGNEIRNARDKGVIRGIVDNLRTNFINRNTTKNLYYVILILTRLLNLYDENGNPRKIGFEFEDEINNKAKQGDYNDQDQREASENEMMKMQNLPPENFGLENYAIQKIFREDRRTIANGIAELCGQINGLKELYNNHYLYNLLLISGVKRSGYEAGLAPSDLASFTNELQNIITQIDNGYEDEEVKKQKKDEILNSLYARGNSLIANAENQKKQNEQGLNVGNQNKSPTLAVTPTVSYDYEAQDLTNHLTADEIYAIGDKLLFDKKEIENDLKTMFFDPSNYYEKIKAAYYSSMMASLMELRLMALGRILMQLQTDQEENQFYIIYNKNRDEIAKDLSYGNLGDIKHYLSQISGIRLGDLAVNIEKIEEAALIVLNSDIIMKSDCDLFLQGDTNSYVNDVEQNSLVQGVREYLTSRASNGAEVEEEVGKFDKYYEGVFDEIKKEHKGNEKRQRDEKKPYNEEKNRKKRLQLDGNYEVNRNVVKTLNNLVRKPRQIYGMIKFIENNPQLKEGLQRNSRNNGIKTSYCKELGDRIIQCIKNAYQTAKTKVKAQYSEFMHAKHNLREKPSIKKELPKNEKKESFKSKNIDESNINIEYSNIKKNVQTVTNIPKSNKLVENKKDNKKDIEDKNPDNNKEDLIDANLIRNLIDKAVYKIDLLSMLSGYYDSVESSNEIYEGPRIILSADSEKDKEAINILRNYGNNNKAEDQVRGTSLANFMSHGIYQVNENNFKISNKMDRVVEIAKENENKLNGNSEKLKLHTQRFKKRYNALSDMNIDEIELVPYRRRISITQRVTGAPRVQNATQALYRTFLNPVSNVDAFDREGTLYNQRLGSTLVPGAPQELLEVSDNILLRSINNMADREFFKRYDRDKNQEFKDDDINAILSELNPEINKLGEEFFNRRYSRGAYRLESEKQKAQNNVADERLTQARRDLENAKKNIYFVEGRNDIIVRIPITYEIQNKTLFKDNYDYEQRKSGAREEAMKEEYGNINPYAVDKKVRGRKIKTAYIKYRILNPVVFNRKNELWCNRDGSVKNKFEINVRYTDKNQDITEQDDAFIRLYDYFDVDTVALISELYNVEYHKGITSRIEKMVFKLADKYRLQDNLSPKIFKAAGADIKNTELFNELGDIRKGAKDPVRITRNYFVTLNNNMYLGENFQRTLERIAEDVEFYTNNNRPIVINEKTMEYAFPEKLGLDKEDGLVDDDDNEEDIKNENNEDNKEENESEIKTMKKKRNSNDDDEEEEDKKEEDSDIKIARSMLPLLVLSSQDDEVNREKYSENALFIPRFIPISPLKDKINLFNMQYDKISIYDFKLKGEENKLAYEEADQYKEKEGAFEKFEHCSFYKEPDFIEEMGDKIEFLDSSKFKEKLYYRINRNYSSYVYGSKVARAIKKSNMKNALKPPKSKNILQEKFDKLNKQANEPEIKLRDIKNAADEAKNGANSGLNSKIKNLNYLKDIYADLNGVDSNSVDRIVTLEGEVCTAAELNSEFKERENALKISENKYAINSNAAKNLKDNRQKEVYERIHNDKQIIDRCLDSLKPEQQKKAKLSRLRALRKVILKNRSELDFARRIVTGSSVPTANKKDEKNIVEAMYQANTRFRENSQQRISRLLVIARHTIMLEYMMAQYSRWYNYAKATAEALEKGKNNVYDEIKSLKIGEGDLSQATIVGEYNNRINQANLTRDFYMNKLKECYDIKKVIMKIINEDYTNWVDNAVAIEELNDLRVAEVDMLISGIDQLVNLEKRILDYEQILENSTNDEISDEEIDELEEQVNHANTIMEERDTHKSLCEKMQDKLINQERKYDEFIRNAEAFGNFVEAKIQDFEGDNDELEQKACDDYQAGLFIEHINQHIADIRENVPKVLNYFMNFYTKKITDAFSIMRDNLIGRQNREDNALKGNETEIEDVEKEQKLERENTIEAVAVIENLNDQVQKFETKLKNEFQVDIEQRIGENFQTYDVHLMKPETEYGEMLQIMMANKDGKNVKVEKKYFERLNGNAAGKIPEATRTKTLRQIIAEEGENNPNKEKVNRRKNARIAKLDKRFRKSKDDKNISNMQTIEEAQENILSNTLNENLISGSLNLESKQEGNEDPKNIKPSTQKKGVMTFSLVNQGNTTTEKKIYMVAKPLYDDLEYDSKMKNDLSLYNKFIYDNYMRDALKEERIYDEVLQHELGYGGVVNQGEIDNLIKDQNTAKNSLMLFYNFKTKNLEIPNFNNLNEDANLIGDVLNYERTKMPDFAEENKENQIKEYREFLEEQRKTLNERLKVQAAHIFNNEPNLEPPLKELDFKTINAWYMNNQQQQENQNPINMNNQNVLYGNVSKYQMNMPGTQNLSYSINSLRQSGLRSSNINMGNQNNFDIYRQSNYYSGDLGSSKYYGNLNSSKVFIMQYDQDKQFSPPPQNILSNQNNPNYLLRQTNRFNPNYSNVFSSVRNVRGLMSGNIGAPQNSTLWNMNKPQFPYITNKTNLVSGRHQLYSQNRLKSGNQNPYMFSNRQDFGNQDYLRSFQMGGNQGTTTTSNENKIQTINPDNLDPVTSQTFNQGNFKQNNPQSSLTNMEDYMSNPNMTSGNIPLQTINENENPKFETYETPKEDINKRVTEKGKKDKDEENDEYGFFTKEGNGPKFKLENEKDNMRRKTKESSKGNKSKEKINKKVLLEGKNDLNDDKDKNKGKDEELLEIYNDRNKDEKQMIDEFNRRIRFRGYNVEIPKSEEINEFQKSVKEMIKMLFAYRMQFLNKSAYQDLSKKNYYPVFSRELLENDLRTNAMNIRIGGLAAQNKFTLEKQKELLENISEAQNLTNQLSIEYQKFTADDIQKMYAMLANVLSFISEKEYAVSEIAAYDPVHTISKGMIPLKLVGMYGDELALNLFEKFALGLAQSLKHIPGGKTQLGNLIRYYENLYKNKAKAASKPMGGLRTQDVLLLLPQSMRSEVRGDANKIQICSSYDGVLEYDQDFEKGMKDRFEKNYIPVINSKIENYNKQNSHSMLGVNTAEMYRKQAELELLRNMSDVRKINNSPRYNNLAEQIELLSKIRYDSEIDKEKSLEETKKRIEENKKAKVKYIQWKDTTLALGKTMLQEEDKPLKYAEQKYEFYKKMPEMRNISDDDVDAYLESEVLNVTYNRDGSLFAEEETNKSPKDKEAAKRLILDDVKTILDSIKNIKLRNYLGIALLNADEIEEAEIKLKAAHRMILVMELIEVLVNYKITNYTDNTDDELKAIFEELSIPTTDDVLTVCENLRDNIENMILSQMEGNLESNHGVNYKNTDEILKNIYRKFYEIVNRHLSHDEEKAALNEENKVEENEDEYNEGEENKVEENEVEEDETYNNDEDSSYLMGEEVSNMVLRIRNYLECRYPLITEKSLNIITSFCNAKIKISEKVEERELINLVTKAIDSKNGLLRELIPQKEIEVLRPQYDKNSIYSLNNETMEFEKAQILKAQNARHMDWVVKAPRLFEQREKAIITEINELKTEKERLKLTNELYIEKLINFYTSININARIENVNKLRRAMKENFENEEDIDKAFEIVTEAACNRQKLNYKEYQNYSTLYQKGKEAIKEKAAKIAKKENELKKLNQKAKSVKQKNAQLEIEENEREPENQPYEMTVEDLRASLAVVVKMFLNYFQIACECTAKLSEIIKMNEAREKDDEEQNSKKNNAQSKDFKNLIFIPIYLAQEQLNYDLAKICWEKLDSYYEALVKADTDNMFNYGFTEEERAKIIKNDYDNNTFVEFLENNVIDHSVSYLRKYDKSVDSDYNALKRKIRDLRYIIQFKNQNPQKYNKNENILNSSLNNDEILNKINEEFSNKINELHEEDKKTIVDAEFKKYENAEYRGKIKEEISKKYDELKEKLSKGDKEKLNNEIKFNDEDKSNFMMNSMSMEGGRILTFEERYGLKENLDTKVKAKYTERVSQQLEALYQWRNELLERMRNEGAGDYLQYVLNENSAEEDKQNYYDLQFLLSLCENNPNINMTDDLQELIDLCQTNLNESMGNNFNEENKSQGSKSSKSNELSYKQENENYENLKSQNNLKKEKNFFDFQDYKKNMTSSEIQTDPGNMELMKPITYSVIHKKEPKKLQPELKWSYDIKGKKRNTELESSNVNMEFHREYPNKFGNNLQNTFNMGFQSLNENYQNLNEKYQNLNVNYQNLENRINSLQKGISSNPNIPGLSRINQLAVFKSNFSYEPQEKMLSSSNLSNKYNENYKNYESFMKYPNMRNPKMNENYNSNYFDGSYNNYLPNLMTNYNKNFNSNKRSRGPRDLSSSFGININQKTGTNVKSSNLNNLSKINYNLTGSILSNNMFNFGNQNKLTKKSIGARDLSSSFGMNINQKTGTNIKSSNLNNLSNINYNLTGSNLPINMFNLKNPVNLTKKPKRARDLNSNFGMNIVQKTGTNIKSSNLNNLSNMNYNLTGSKLPINMFNFKNPINLTKKPKRARDLSSSFGINSNQKFGTNLKSSNLNNLSNMNYTLKGSNLPINMFNLKNPINLTKKPKRARDLNSNFGMNIVQKTGTNLKSSNLNNLSNMNYNLTGSKLPINMFNFKNPINLTKKPKRARDLTSSFRININQKFGTNLKNSNLMTFGLSDKLKNSTTNLINFNIKNSMFGYGNQNNPNNKSRRRIELNSAFGMNNIHQSGYFQRNLKPINNMANNKYGYYNGQNPNYYNLENTMRSIESERSRFSEDYNYNQSFRNYGNSNLQSGNYNQPFNVKGSYSQINEENI